MRSTPAGEFDFEKVAHIFWEIHEATGGLFREGCGSYLFDGATYQYDAHTLAKQQLLARAASQAHSVLEIGTYLGHSLLVMLASNPSLHVTTIDIDAEIAAPAVEVLKKHFPLASIEFIHGSSLDVLRTLTRTYDLFHIDGTHEAPQVWEEWEAVLRYRSSSVVNVVFDDVDSIWSVVEGIKQTATVVEETVPDCAWRNAYYKLAVQEASMSSRVAVVTGYVPIPGFPRSEADYERLGAELSKVSVPVHVFRGALEHCWLAEHVRGRNVSHAIGDNPTKNTLDYHIVQHQKTAWLVAALELSDADVFVWVDYGIFHQPDITVDAVDTFLRRVTVEDAVIIPGCLPMRVQQRDSTPDWRFCGSSIIVPRARVLAFHEAVRDVTLDRLAVTNRVTWEINDWARVESRKMVPIRWYQADHDVSQFMNYQPPLQSAASQPTNGRLFRPAFSPRSCYELRDDEEASYFQQHGGAPEAALIDWSTQFIRHDETFIDIGAHIGTWSQHFAFKCKQVHAFEPQGSTFARLCGGVDRAKLRNVQCHNMALGASGELDLHMVSPDGGGSTLRHRDELGAVLGVERVRCAQLDDFEFDNVGVIKVDAEGFELDILRGAARTIETHHPTLLLEAWTHEWNAKAREKLIAHVVDLGYGLTSINGWPEMILAEHPKRRTAATFVETTGDFDSSRAEPVQDRPLLGLVMIVKNESKRILDVLTSYRPYINAWTILDTGSTDGTQELIKGALEGIPGALHEEPFVDFTTSRNRALELHGTGTVFSIMPNGDVLEGGAELVTFLEARRTSFDGSYRVRIAPGHYYHPLVMRTGAGWRYRWRTHECAVGPRQGPQIPGVLVLRDRGTRTDAEWKVRWERDIGLLNQDREEDPTDPRPVFYLGQTYDCLGRHAEALEMYEKRSTMGGYFDEVYEAKFRVAKMKGALGHPWAGVQQAYLDAFAFDPRRAEPLYAISEHWYDKNVHAVARIFAATAAAMPIPPTDLFLDESVYTWKAADRASISAFYTGHKKQARGFAEQAVSFLPHDGRIRANRAFCSPSALELFAASSRAIEWVAPEGWHLSNPSICVHEGRLRCIVRTVNYQIINGAYMTPAGDVVQTEGRYKNWKIIRTRNFLLDLGDDYRPTKVVEMEDKTDAPRTDFPIRGFEDARLFSWKGAWWATATVCDFTEEGNREIALLQLDEDGSVVRAEPLRGPWSDRHQKNWMPVVDGDHLKFIYATSLDGDVGSATIFDLVDKDGAHAVVPPVGAVFDLGVLRGGSQGVKVDGGWLFLVHDVATSDRKRMYLHRFVFLDESLQLVSMTDLFYFEQLGIEFCAGLAQLGDALVASYSVNDGSARFGIFSLPRVLAQLRRDFVI